MFNIIHQKIRHFLFMFTILLIFGCQSILPSTATSELRDAYEKYNEVTVSAYLTLDTSKLSDVATGEVLVANVASVEERKKGDSSYPIGYEVKIFPLFGFEKLELTDDQALIQVRTQTQYFHLDPQTGEKIYSGGNDWYLEKVEMVKENDVWKVKEFVQVEKWID